jgi:hypothetical protein
VLVEIGLGFFCLFFRVFLLHFFLFQNLPLFVNFLSSFLCVLWFLFISKVAWSQKHIGPSTSLFFCQFWFFFYFFLFFKSEQYQCRLNKKNQ